MMIDRNLKQNNISRSIAFLSLALSITLHALILIMPSLSDKKKPKEFNELKKMGALKIRSLQMPDPQTSSQMTQAKEQDDSPSFEQNQQHYQHKSPTPRIPKPSEDGERFKKLAKKMADIMHAGPTQQNQQNPSPPRKGAVISQSRQMVPRQAQKISEGMPMQVQRFISKSDFFVDLESAKKQKDHLNEDEKVLYGFLSRVIIAYYNSLLNNLSSYRDRHPYLQNFPFISEERLVRLRARAVFDRNGNLVSIKMLQWSGEEHLQNFFIESLEKMQGIPNPPQMITSEDNGEFVFLYGLDIRS